MIILQVSWFIFFMILDQARRQVKELDTYDKRMIISAILGVAWLIGMCSICHYVHKAVSFRRNRKVKERRDSDSSVCADLHTDAVLIAYMMNDGGYDYYDDGLVFDGVDMWADVGGVDFGGGGDGVFGGDWGGDGGDGGDWGGDGGGGDWGGDGGDGGGDGGGGD